MSNIKTINKFSNDTLDGFITELMKNYRENNIESISIIYNTNEQEPKMFLWGMNLIETIGCLEMMKHGFLADALFDYQIEPEEG